MPGGNAIEDRYLVNVEKNKQSELETGEVT